MPRSTLGVVGMALLALGYGAVAYNTGCAATIGSFGDNDGGDTDGAVDPDAPTDDSGIPVPNNAAIPDGVTISEIAGFQTVKVPIMKGGSAASGKAPLVANKDAMIRVYVSLDASYSPHALVGVLDVTSGGSTQTFKAALTPSASSTDDAIETTFNFYLSAGTVTPDAEFKARIVEQTSTAPPSSAPSPGRYPQDGTSTASMNVQSTGSQLKITFVPIQYNADGSGRLPDSSPSQMATFKNTMIDLYPIPNVVFTMHAPVAWGSTIAANGSGWGQVLQMLTNLRQQEGAAADEYWYGAFEPASSFAGFCGGGCVAGLSSISQTPADTWARASVGLGYTGAETAYTMAHEVGHAHGRAHSPCGGAQGVDPNYPYPGANIGVWGISYPDKTLIAPSTGKDIMGYCQPQWISDYTYGALFTRIKTVNGAAWVQGAPRTYRWGLVDGNGNVTLGDRVTTTWPPGGQQATFGGKTGFYYPYDHIPGGMMVIPE